MSLLTLEQIQSLSKAELGRMTSDSFKENHDKTNPNFEQFRARVDAVEAQPAQATRKAGSVRGPEPTPASAQPFDPSFDDSPNPAPAAVQPAQQPVVETPAELPEQTFEYQPVSKTTGKPVGGLQRFKYRTQDELIQKLAAAHSAASVRIRELSRDRKLEDIVSSGPTAKNFTPSTEVPKTMDELAKELLEQRQQNFLLSVREALNAFQLSVDWSKYRSQAAAESIILAVQKAGDDPTDPQSYHRAFLAMKEFLEPVVPVAAPVVEVPAPAPVAAAAPAVPKVRTVGVSTGFSNADLTSSNDPFEVVAPTQTTGVRLTMPNGQKQVMTLQEWNRQSSEFQKRVLRSSANVAQIEALYDAEDQRRAAARR
jgi:hypothetical protein